jgi:hypothetical protein
VSAVTAFELLVERIAAREPRNGFQTVRDLPELTMQEVGTVLDHEPKLAADAMEDEIVRSIAATLRSARVNRPEGVMFVGCQFIEAMRPIVLRYLLSEVRGHCEALECDRHYVESRQAAADAAGVSLSGEL